MQLVKIIANGKSIHMPDGKVYMEHPDMAKLLVEEMGVAKYADEEKQNAFQVSKKQTQTVKKNKNA